MTPMSFDEQTNYGYLSQVASPEASEGLTRSRAVLLLWFLRNVIGIDDLDAYEHVCDGPGDRGIDGMYVEEDDFTGIGTLVILQSKYPQTPKNVGRTDVAEFLGIANQCRTVEGVQALLADPGLEPELRALLIRNRVEERLAAGTLKVRLIFVTAGILQQDAQELVASTNVREGAGFLTVYDLRTLGPLAKSVLGPQPVSGEVVITTPSSERFVMQIDGRDHIVAAVKASEIVAWPGIDDRSLFDLNVRNQLRPNNVSKALRQALARSQDHPNFLAFHNGLTVVCNGITTQDESITVQDMSVVNGAQSVVALLDQAAYLTDELKLVVKFIEIGEHHQVAREIARRSNTQNPVNQRNLRALSGVQLRLLAEFKTEFPTYTYVTRPRYGEPLEGTVIENDHAAQLLCAIYNQQPWLAVKVLALFQDHYTAVFSTAITAAHIVLADLIEQRVRAGSSRVPSNYLASKKLTELVMVYLVGQLLRTDDALAQMLKAPATALEDRPALEAKLDELVGHAAGTLQIRAQEHRIAETYDDFKVDFKNREVLTKLGKEAAKLYVYAKATQATPAGGTL
ncbi:hypothetical protein GJV82_14435 [Cellulosimicrobium sp. BIT-GX5]|uniref:Abortive phage infection protein C-terminal domain-containing protein n=2 Tax=Cellulosimicrobium composti TaxID=2672572 RepID=A0A6N7ZKT9_9MICO|nr:hypothetical protein [Cellulosimicrobium composti]